MKPGFLSLITALLVCTTAWAGDSSDSATETAPTDWRLDWGVDENFTIEVDTAGYAFPTAIAFVPDPGNAPDDPLYFVTELRGKVKVVTNDRSVHVFAEDFFDLVPKEELPSGQGQAGLAGLCLEPENGYLYVTFAYQDDSGVLRNNMVRFQSTPGRFSLQPESMIAFTDIFKAHKTGLAHHIGPCQVMGDNLLVSVGEGWRPLMATKLDEMFGKLIRMTLDGKPVAENPYYVDDRIDRVRNYVWAYGLRNPFGLSVIGDRVIVADNGLAVDRFLEVEEGLNYLWQGDDETIASNASYVWTPSQGPVQMDYSGAGKGDFPAAYAEQFYVGLSAFRADHSKSPGIFRVPYSLDEQRIVEKPDYFVRYRGDQWQMVSGVAFGPDGLYFSPLAPVSGETAAVLKVRYDPEADYPTATAGPGDAQLVFREKGCLGCHTIGKNDWGGNEGPPLMKDTLAQSLLRRLHSEAYVDSVLAVHDSPEAPLPEFRAAREEVLAATGMERVELWLKYRTLEPRFDNQYSKMPDQGVTEAGAQLVAEYFVQEPAAPEGVLATLKYRIKNLLPSKPRHRHLAFSAAGGFALGLVFMGLAIAVVRRRSS